MLVLLFMAVTSSTSAELIAVSSLLTFDVYKTYMKPDATSSALVTVSHYGIVIYSLVLAAFCCILNAVGLNLTWLLTILAIMVGGASIPIGMVLLWKRMSTVATVASPWIGLVCGLMAWFITTWKRSGSISVATSGDTINAVAGNITSWGVGFVLSIVLSLAFPAKYSSTDPKHIERSNKIQGISVDVSSAATPNADSAEKSGSPADRSDPTDEKMPVEPRSDSQPEAVIPTGNEIVDFLEAKQMEPMDPVAVKKGERLAIGANVVFGTVAIILVPFTLFGTGYIYERSFFRGWVVVSFIWVWVSMIICVIYPVVESTGALREVSKGLWRDTRALFGKKPPKAATATNEA
jgi:urea-proton symporter